jgi:hypothetical protein
MNLDTSENTAQITSPKEGTGSDRSIPDTSIPDTSITEQMQTPEAIEQTDPPISPEPKPSYVKLAMRNMVKKRGLSLQHFFLTTIALVAFLVGLSYLTR